MLLKATPDSILPDLKGRLMVNSYLGGGASNPYLTRHALNIPGARGSILAYLSGRGSNMIPKLVEKELGDKWYTGPAKLLSRAPIIKNIVLDKISDKIMPELHGSKDIAKSFVAHGGMV